MKLFRVDYLKILMPFILVFAGFNLCLLFNQNKITTAKEQYKLNQLKNEINLIAPTDDSNKLLVKNEIIKMAGEYGVNVKDALRIAQCESGFYKYAKNKHSTAQGVYQFTNPTWKLIKAPGHQFDYKENIKQFMIYYPIHAEWWECK